MSNFLASQLPIAVENVAELVTKRTNDGGILQTAGYETRGDGGAGKYVYHSTGKAALIASNSGSDNLSAIIDNGFYFAGTGDDYYELSEKRYINVRQFGAVGGRLRDDTDAFFRAAGAAIRLYNNDNNDGNSIATINIPPGYYRIRHLALNAAVCLIGSGGIADKVNIAAWEGAGTCTFAATAADNTFTTEFFPWFVGQPIEFFGASLPTGIVAGKTYYVRTTSHKQYSEATTTTFTLSHYPKSGAELNLTSDGSGSAIHGRFITDQGNATKITMHNLHVWGNVWDGFSSRTRDDPEYITPYVYEALSLGATPRKGSHGAIQTHGSIVNTNWGTGSDLTGTKVNQFHRASGYEIEQNISRMTLCWSAECGQGIRCRGNGLGITNSYITGNRGVYYQFYHSKVVETDYAVNSGRIFSDEPIPVYNTVVYFIGDDLPSGLTAQKPYYVRTTEVLSRFTVDTGASATTITNTDSGGTPQAHGFVDGMRIWFDADDLPSGLSLGTKYYIVNAATNTFEVSLTKGGAAVNLGDDGSGTLTWYLNSFSVSETPAGSVVDLVDDGSGEIRYSIYSTSALDIEGNTSQFDIEIEAPYSYVVTTVNSSESLQAKFLGFYTSLDNSSATFTALASTDVFTASAATLIQQVPETDTDGREIYFAGDSLPTGIIANRRYFVRDLSGTTFKVAETSGGAAVNITTDGSGTLAVTPIPDYLVRWLQFAGSMSAPHVSEGQRGYTNFALIAESTTREKTIAFPEGFQLSTTRSVGKVYAEQSLLPNKDGYAVITGYGTTNKSARLLLDDWKAVFNGTDRQVALSATVPMTVADEYTIAFKCSVSTLNTILAGHTVSGDSFVANFTTATNWRYRAYNSTAYYVDATLPTACNDGDPHTYLLVRSGTSTFALYQDGVLCSIAGTGTPISAFGWFDIIGRQGSTGTPAYFDGDIYYLKAWDRAFTAGEITSALSETFPTDTLFDMPFTDAAGSVLTDFGSGGLVGAYTGTGDLFASTDTPSGYTAFSNLSTDRTCDADSTTLEEVADILGTLIEDLKTRGIISA